MKPRYGKGRKALSHGARSAGKCTVTNRFEAVNCQACGRKVKRKSRQQRYCSDRCRDFAWRENKASGQPTNPIFLSNKNNRLQGRQTGSSIPLNVLGGYRWPNAVGVDHGLLRKIVRAEIGDTR
jgi:hypothetical protein